MLEGDLLFWLSVYNVNSFLNLLSSFYLKPVIDSPTRITQNSASLLDNIFTNVNSHVNPGIFLCDISDHLPVFLVTSGFNQIKENPPRKYVKRIINESNLQSFYNKISNVKWGNHLTKESVDENYNTFVQVFKENYEECFPLKSFSFKNKNKNPWLTRELIKLCQKKSQLYKKFIKNPTPHRKEAYKKFRNYVTLKLRQAKKQYFNIKFDKVKDNIKSTWKVINNLLNKKRQHLKIDSLEYEDKIISNKHDIANSFNNFFVDIGKKLQDSNVDAKQNSFKKYLKTPNKKTIFLRPITKSEIITIVDNMKNNTSSSIDNIDFKVVKYVIPLII